jgi:hypothetical protein
MSLEDTELTIGGTSFKGVYIAILLSLATTIGGGVWTASSLYSRLETAEARYIPDILPLEERTVADKQELLGEIQLIKQALEDNNVSQLQGKLAALGVNLETIIAQQQTLLLLSEEVNDLEKEIETMKATVTTAQIVTEKVVGFDGKVTAMNREINDLWSAMDFLSENPLK